MARTFSFTIDAEIKNIPVIAEGLEGFLLTPPPAPLPTMTTSASKVRSAASSDASTCFQPEASPSRNGSRIIPPLADRDSRWLPRYPVGRTRRRI